MKDIKLTLKALRVLYGLTQAQAAKLIGVSEDTWFNYENAKTFPNTNKLKTISTVFDINIDSIIFQKNVRLKRTNKL